MEKNNFLYFLKKEIEDNSLHHSNIIICKNEDEIDSLVNDISDVYKKNYNFKFKFPEVFIKNSSNISKDEILKLIDEFSISPIEELPRVFFIRRVDLMSESASNSFLKFLEEPTKNTYGFMFAIKDVNIIDTIKSRSKIIDILSLRNKKYYFIDKLNKNNVLILAKELSTNKRSDLISDFELYYLNNHNKFNNKKSEYYLEWLNNLSYSANINIILENLLITIWEVINERC